MDLKDIDRNISLIAARTAHARRMTPCNREEEKKKFLREYYSGRRYDPVFRYDLSSRFSQETKALGELKENSKDKGDLGEVLCNKADILEKEIKMLFCEESEFTLLSEELYGKPEEEDIVRAREIIEKERKATIASETLPPEEMAGILQKALNTKGLCWKCELDPEIVPKMSVSGKNRVIYINPNMKYRPPEALRLIVHEVETHVLRGENGAKQPYLMFSEGLPGYGTTEEGLAIYAEEISGCLKNDPDQKRIYAARALAVDLARRTGFYDIFVQMKRYFSDEISYRLVERVKRGLKFTASVGCLTRDVRYMAGWRKVTDHFDKGGGKEVLYSGKIGIEDIEWVENAIDRGDLFPPQKVPLWLEEKRAGINRQQ